MRRGFSIFLILFFGLGPLSALVPGSEDAGLPPCCRRHGKHHCAMYAQIMAMRARFGFDPHPSFEAPSTCPLYHGPSALILVPVHAMTAAPAKPRIAMTRSFPPALLRTEAASTPSLAYAGRGPPVTNPS